MAATEGTVGLNTQFGIETTASPQAFTTIGEVKDITHSGKTVEFAEFTHMQSTSGYREYKPTFKNSGNFTFACNYVGDDTGQDALETAVDNSTLTNFEVVFPDDSTTTLTFSAYVENYGFSNPMNGPIELNISIRITGAITRSVT